MNGELIDFIVLKVLPCALFAVGLFIYAFTQNFRVWLKKIFPLLLGFGMLTALDSLGIFSNNSFYLFLIAFLTLLWFLILHYRNVGLALFACGGLSNAFVSLINGGKMPAIEGGFSRIYQPMTDKTILPFLGDWISSFYGNYLLSFGDILLMLGIYIFFMQGLFELRKKLKEKNKI